MPMVVVDGGCVEHVLITKNTIGKSCLGIVERLEIWRIILLDTCRYWNDTQPNIYSSKTMTDIGKDQ